MHIFLFSLLPSVITAFSVPAFTVDTSFLSSSHYPSHDALKLVLDAHRRNDREHAKVLLQGLLRQRKVRDPQSLRRLSEVTPDEAMDNAIDAATQTVEYLENFVEDVLVRANETREELRIQRVVIEGLTDEALDEYMEKLARAGVLLTNADIESKVLMQSVKELTEISISELEEARGDDQRMQEAVEIAQITLGAALDQAAEKIEKELKLNVMESQILFEECNEMSEHYAQLIVDLIDNKNGALDRKIQDRRRIIRDVCIGLSVVSPPLGAGWCSVSFATTHDTIVQWKREMRKTRDSLRAIEVTFRDLSADTALLSDIAAEKHELLAATQTDLETTSAMLVASSELPYWENTIIPELHALVGRIDESFPASQ